ncbi:MAG: UDP-N-acetylmuramyl-tripeptide synthetase [Candidatus Saccharibacteria bacterium]|nr:UDP-N-acetylmuramyl-tripeptide synthetase [Candidatus Saccharibacteria bacterium]
MLEAMAEEAAAGFPAKNMKVIGVTGTDGKTSTCTLISAMLRNAGYKVAMMTTISIDYGDGVLHDNPTRLTSLGSAQLIKRLKQIKAKNPDWLVLETTSHALAQHRVWGVPYSIGVMTNVGHEHLDYHRTFERYRDAKKMLFKHVNSNKKGLRVGIANADDPSGALFAAAVKNPVLYGVDKGDLKAIDIKPTPSGSTYIATIGSETFNITCHLPGSFNVYNSLACVAVGRAIGLSKEQIEQGIASLNSVEGRMTRVDEGQDFDVIVDYAHTPESFEKVIKEVRPLVKGRIITVFGSAGRRDIEKRAAQGEVAGRLGDIVIPTEEDDRDIDGNEILEQIASGAEKAGKVKGKDLFLILKREEAIEKAVSLAQKGDMILLLGKGHEKSILYNGPKATEYRSRPQDDTDPERVLKRDYDEVSSVSAILKKK